MKDSSKRTVSRLLAFVMLVSSMCTNMVIANSEDGVVLNEDVLLSEEAIEMVDNSTEEVVVEAVDTLDVVTPEAGQTYSVDFGQLDTNADLTNYVSGDGIFSYSNIGGGKFHSAGYGLAVKPGDVLKVAVAGNADISLMLSSYAPADSKFVVTDDAGNRVGEVSAYVATDKTENVFKYLGNAGTLTFTYEGAGQGYLRSVTAANAAAPINSSLLAFTPLFNLSIAVVFIIIFSFVIINFIFSLDFY